MQRHGLVDLTDYYRRHHDPHGSSAAKLPRRQYCIGNVRIVHRNAQQGVSHDLTYRTTASPSIQSSQSIYSKYKILNTSSNSIQYSFAFDVTRHHGKRRTNSHDKWKVERYEKRVKCTSRKFQVTSFERAIILS